MPNAKSPKTMSSRLLTMKFMQRAAAASASSTPNTDTSTNNPATPTPSQQHQQQTYDAVNAFTPSPKRQKISSPSISAPSTPATGNTDLEAISAAIRAEEEKRAAAVARQAAKAGEEEWVIEYPPGTFPEPPPQTSVDGGNVYGFGDAEEEEVMGRQSFGGFKRKVKRGVPMAAASSSHDADGDAEDDEDEADRDERGSEDSEDEDDDDLDALMKNAKLKAEKKRPERRREQHNKKRKSGNGAVDLSRLTSISGGVDKGEQQRQHQRHQNQRGGSGRKGRR